MSVTRIPASEQPFPWFWEQDPRIDDGHAHDWEMIIVERVSVPDEACTRCKVCLCPRCGHTFDDDPCLERRHHRGLHIYESGRFEPVGGYLRDDEAR